MTSIVFINPGHDTGGAGYAFKAAFEAESDWDARAICRSTTYLHYPTDIVWTPRNRSRTMKLLLESADVVHALNSYKPLGWFRARPNQVLVVHHLGSTYRRDPEGQSAICRELGAIEVTDSIDLLFDGIGWLPIPADLEGLVELRRRHYEPSRTIRIAHAPTDREYKDTEAVIRAVESLSRRYRIEFDLIERVPNRECLARKARADIFVDQLKYGFGLNAIEAWAMGIPVVSGLDSDFGRRKGLEMWGSLPWADATPATLEAVIEHLIFDAEWRAALAERGRAHVERWHSQRSVVERALATYERARQRVAA